MLALDFAGSPTLQAPYTRLEAVKDVIRGFIRHRPGDNLGLVAFAGASCAVSPLTTQHPWLLQRLSAVQVGFLPDGTALGDALGSCLNRLLASQDPHQPHGQILILMSDGVQNCGSTPPLVAAQALRDHGIQVYTIGVGRGGLVPTLHLNAQGSLARNALGQLDLVKANIPTDEATLQAIARITQGRFFRATHPEELQAIYQSIHALHPGPLQAHAVRVQREWMAWPLALGMGLLIIEHALRCKRYLQV
jgi:Ca-activated chloride channel family protein